MAKCLSASTTVIGGMCTSCDTDHWPTALKTAETATAEEPLGSNKCDTLANFPGAKCEAASTTVVGGMCS